MTAATTTLTLTAGIWRYLCLRKDNIIRGGDLVGAGHASFVGGSRDRGSYAASRGVATLIFRVRLCLTRRPT